MTVTPVGKVASRSLSSLADSDSEEIQDGGFESAAAYAAKGRLRSSPRWRAPRGEGGEDQRHDADPRRAGVRGRDVLLLLVSFRGVYPFRFWGASAVGPGQTGGARKLGRRDVVSVVAQMPEDKAKEEDYELLRAWWNPSGFSTINSTTS